MSETKTLKAIELALSQGECRLLRNNIGQAWQGKVSRAPPGPWAQGSLIIQAPRVVHFGLAGGSSDLIGFKSVTVTPEMVGIKLAIFTSIEVKAAGRFQKGQRDWLAMVKEFGGIAGVAHSVEEAQAIVK
jgi:VRR-NUC domain